MRALRGASLWSWVGGIAAVVLVALFLRWALRSDAQVVSDAIDDARDALVAGDDDAFLAFFSPDVTYQGGGDMESLRKDLATWHRYGIAQVHVLDRTIEVEQGTASVHLLVAAGPELLRIDRVDVDLLAVKEEGGTWRVRTFSWKRP